MDTQQIISALDVEIGRLRQVRELLAGVDPVQRRAGRPKGSAGKGTAAETAAAGKGRRKLSPEARERIAAAQRARWAAHAASKAGDGAGTKPAKKAGRGRPKKVQEAKAGSPE